MIPKRAFGRTGHLSTRTIFGAAAFGGLSQEDADRTLDLLLEYGVNHLDTAAGYGDSELRIGPWMDRHRADFFLATKTQERTYAAARDGIHRSLDRLRTDSVDLLQLHFLVDPGEWEIAMGPAGALEAAVEAKEQGLASFIGVTGHELAAPVMHLRSLERYDFDAVLLPMNYMLMQNPQYRADFDALLALCREREVAVQTIKSLARGHWGEREKVRTTWYEPLEDQADIDLAVHYVLGREQVYLNSTGDIDILPRVLHAASRFEVAPAEADMAALAERLGMTALFV